MGYISCVVISVISLCRDLPKANHVGHHAHDMSCTYSPYKMQLQQPLLNEWVGPYHRLAVRRTKP